MTIEFDAIGHAQQLESAGVARNQADLHAKALTEVASAGVSTSDHVQMKDEWQRDIRRSEERLSSQITLAKTELSAELQTFRTESSAKIEVLDAKIDGVRTDLTTNIDGVRTDLTAKIDAVRTDLTAKIDGVRTDLNAKVDSVKEALTVHRWLLGVLLVMNSAIFARIYFP
ncbi:hypothetical protein F2P44_24205 [Massilia sp. CCM 8695]|uniref:DUF1640 domain-containing protein n=1 Tax=Massilia frigida TaxID=2609281 RepID=A0ABX0NJV1_9BURK|nr:hypothetical protein [Massilia frigida]NHZ82360.1 hypothetical protein [Massilia frigida]